MEAMMACKTIDDLGLAGKVVLTRVDINVPMEGGVVTDATRIEKIAPTFEDIIARGGKVVLLAHFGRPKGKVVDEMSLRHVVGAVQVALGRKVVFGADCVGPVAAAAIAAAGSGDVALLENTRFHAGEEKNDPALAAEMAALGDIYVNDAFSAAHRAHSSTEGLARLLPAAAGRLMEAELRALEAALGTPERPVVAGVGGGEVSAERDMAATALEILAKANAAGCSIHLPVDIVIAREFKAGAANETLPVDACPADAMILDAGPATVAKLRLVFEASKTLIWNGPLGAFEIEPFNAATNAAAREAADLTRAGKLISVAGGGDTVAALNQAGAAGDFTFISTAGGAFLEWMEGKELPGVAALHG